MKCRVKNNLLEIKIKLVGGYKLSVKSKRNCENVKKDVDLNRIYKKKKFQKSILVPGLLTAGSQEHGTLHPQSHCKYFYKFSYKTKSTIIKSYPFTNKPGYSFKIQ